MLAHKFMSFSEACTMLSCTNDDLRRWVMEDRVMSALLVSPGGHSSPFDMRGLQVYEVSDTGAVTDCRTGRAAGHLRFEKAEVIRHLAEWAHAEAAALPLAELFVSASVAPTTADVVELNRSLLATPTELLDAFKQWGMKATWFKDLNSRKWLLNARRQKGQGQRGHVVEPLFCPFVVMNGFIGKVRKTNRRQPDNAWRTLEHKFPDAHAAFEQFDPRKRTGE